MDNNWNPWKLTAIGMALVGVTAVVTGLVVGHGGSSRPVPEQIATMPSPTASPSASPRLAAEPNATTTPAPHPKPAPAPKRVAGTPPQTAVDACNRHAEAEAGPTQTTKDKTIDVVKDAAIGAAGGAAAGALGGAIAGGGKSAGKGAAIGGLVGAGGGTLYGIYENKQHDEKYRTAYSNCMKQRGYTG